MRFAITILHLIDATMTWMFGRNTEYGLIFKKLTGSAWKFWPARAAFFAVVFAGCEIYRAHLDNGLYWFAIGEQTQVIVIIAEGLIGSAIAYTIAVVAIAGVAVMVSLKMSVIFTLGAALMFLYSWYAKRKSGDNLGGYKS